MHVEAPFSRTSSNLRIQMKQFRMHHDARFAQKENLVYKVSKGWESSTLGPRLALSLVPCQFDPRKTSGPTPNHFRMLDIGVGIYSFFLSPGLGTSLDPPSHVHCMSSHACNKSPVVVPQ